MSDETLHTKVAILEREILQYNNLIEKFDMTIERLSDVSNSLKNLVVVHEQRLTQQEKKTEDIVEKMNDEIKQLVDMMKGLALKEDEHYRDLSTRMYAVEKWKWTIIGGAIVVGIFTSKIDLSKLFTFLQ